MDLMLSFSENISFIILLLVLIAIIILYTFRKKKYNDEVSAMHKSLKKDDEVITYSGIVGKIVSIESDDNGNSLVLATGSKTNIGYIRIDSKAVFGKLNDVATKEDAKTKSKPEVKEELKSEEATEKPVEKKTVTKTTTKK